VSRPKRGDRFTHDRFLAPGWQPDRHQVWSDAPKAEMVVTDVRGGHVHFTYVKAHREWSRTSFEMPQAVFLDRFGDALRPALTVVDGEGYTDLMDRLGASHERLRAVPDTD
jgi:hypothetical protein